MPLSPGTRLGPYEITGPLGVGGMGEVYRARDTRLERSVAVKILPAHLSARPEARQRFEREARAVSGLSHPNICALFDVGHQDGTDFLVMECLEGETLGERLKRGPLPVEELLQLAIQVADGLDKAHRSGVIHRDLKPSNIMLTKTGAKLLDFGLAKSTEPGAAATNLTASPTADSPLTAEGTIVGTFQYMAPEQIEGRTVDARSDIFSFGALLYEMATGMKAFEGKTQASLIAAILEREPPSIASLQPLAPPALDRLVHACLAKSPDDRRQTMQDVLLDLRWIDTAGSQAGLPAPIAARRKSRERLAWGVAAVAVLAAIVASAGLMNVLSDAAAERAVKSTVLPPEEGSQDFLMEGLDSGSLTVSPDGRYLTFAAPNSEGEQVLWLRPLDSLEAHPLPGTHDGKHPFWSPDSRHIAFFSGGKLKRVDLAGSPALSICPAGNGRSGTWNEDGVILFSPSTLEPIHRVPAGGGTPEPVTTLDKDRQETTHRWATFLPDGRHFLFMAGGHASAVGSETHAVFVGDLESDMKKLIVHARSNASYASGHLLYVRDRVLLAHPFDPDTLELTGDPFPVAAGVQYDAPYFRGVFAASNNGVLAYRTGVIDRDSRLTWLDREGNETGSLGEPAEYSDLRLSPDEKRLALAISDPGAGTSDIWLYELTRGIPTRFTFGRLNEDHPVWSPDGTRVVFSSVTEIWSDLYVKNASGAGDEELLLASEKVKEATDWSPDGKFIVFNSFDPQGPTEHDIFILPLSGEREPFPYLQTEFHEANSRFSPDGNWLAYTSRESGKDEVYVSAFPGPGGKWQVSNGGGDGAIWTKNGKEIVYAGPGPTLMAVQVTTGPSTFVASSPVKIAPIPQRVTGGDMTRDGQRIIVAVGTEAVRSFPITLVTNWPAAIEEN